MTLILGRMAHTVYLEKRVQVADGEGGLTTAPTALDPPKMKAWIETASQRGMERLASGAIISEASHVIRARYHRDVDRQTQLTWTDRAGKVHIANVLDVNDLDGRANEMIIIAAEVVP